MYLHRKMRLARPIILLVWLSLSMAERPTGSPDSDSAVCDENWVFKEGLCYFFSEPEDIVKVRDIADVCLLSDAEPVYPSTEKELTFLQSQAKGRNTYGWFMGLIKSFYNDEIHIPRPISFYRSGESSSVSYHVPKLQKSFDKDNKCVALHVGYKLAYGYSVKVEITTEPCNLNLWVACQSKKSNFPTQDIDYEKWFSSGDLVFWVSGRVSNQAEAKSICEEESMELITSVVDLMTALNATYDLTPWWTDFSLGQNGPQRKDGTLVDLEKISWLPETYEYGAADIMLLHSGTMRYAKDLYYDENVGLPYMCKKRPIGSFGCPHLWIRGGRSCYFMSKQSSYLTWSEAKKHCETRDSHLISVNSIDERLWIEAVASRYVRTVWTSANDINKEGSFTWHDGSEIDTIIFPWMKATFGEWSFQAEEKCATFNPMSSRFGTAYCHRQYYSVCQYDLREGETECAENWSILDGTCYFFDQDSGRISFNRVRQNCNNLLQDRIAFPVMIKTKKIAEFIAKLTESLYYIGVWMGMERDGPTSSWRWRDSSLVDFSVFDLKDQPDNGNGGDPENCVVLNTVLQAFDAKCKQRYGYICEKDLPPVGKLGPAPGGATAPQTLTFVPFLSVMTGLFFFRYFW